MFNIFISRKTNLLQDCYFYQ